MAKNKPNENGDGKTRESISKTEAVRKAVEQGWTKPSEGVLFVKTMFGIDLSPSHFSNIKSTLRPEPAPKPTTPAKKRGRPPGRKNQPKPKPMLAAAVVELGENRVGMIDIEAVQQVKELVGKLGRDTMKGLVEALS